ncbi:rhodanese-like domain-containing protein [Leptolyngbya sp. FACHB-711]|uniref:rhodanese-like domain-containing protein n=1 Tax=unclassified Leptolyngbya TaxID=2650499 RepID=UPI001687CD6F|nr:rhodanese-like domain-containing protein [Leptolyngbya sp. FACHB-711]MBD1853469.1 rhodanese-like domain-containing protein [Cyanobacteria bacterium FACHB-502]MBD2027466.1 rhodanese-like domain-containing protein [Leptolyngbya sp. FACHB-711]
MDNIQDLIVKAKDNLPDVTPTPPEFHSQATAYELKSRLEWGEPGLTILDVRDHDAFNDCRILGAMTMPMDKVPGLAESTIRKERDLYVYGNDDEQSAQAAQLLRQAGFQHVAELKGGLKAWREIEGSIEGVASNESPGPGAYNVVERLKDFAQEKAHEKPMQ